MSSSPQIVNHGLHVCPNVPAVHTVGQADQSSATRGEAWRLAPGNPHNQAKNGIKAAPRSLINSPISIIFLSVSLDGYTRIFAFSLALHFYSKERSNFKPPMIISQLKKVCYFFALAQ